MKFKKVTLRWQIFLSIIGLISFSLAIVAGINIFQINQDIIKYNEERLNRKDRAVAKSVEAMIDYSIAPEKAFNDVLSNIGHIHKLNLNIYDLEGNFILSSDTAKNRQSAHEKIEPRIIKACFDSSKIKKENMRGVYRVLYKPENNKKLHTSNPIITNEPFCLVEIIYDKSPQDQIYNETWSKAKELIILYILLLIIAVLFAYFLLKQITRPLRSIATHLSSVGGQTKIEPISWPVKDEIGQLVDSYNKLMVELDVRTKQLVKSEKEGAWKKMANQIAHEIKNPLTPMRLNVQYLQKSFNDGKGRKLYSDEWEEKLLNFSKTMIQQIDTLNRIANSFSDFSSLNAQHLEHFSVVTEVERVVNLFEKNNVTLIADNNIDNKIHVFIDKSHLTRVLNNLINNSIQAEKLNRPIKVVVKIQAKKTDCIISVSDNGVGIPKDIQSKIFEPNFTTKNSGMGLGLAMIKKIVDDFKGSITYETSPRGTIFNIKVPLSKNKE